MTLPTLYKKGSTGAILCWDIRVDPVSEMDAPGVVLGQISVIHGQLGGAAQSTFDLIREGKNVGKANETTPLQQAEAEARARWTKAKKKGYVESAEDAAAGIVDSLIEGGIPPMLAPNKSYPKDDDLIKRIKFPCVYQPKLDGMRCIAAVDNGTATLWSRTRKRINSVPHIVEALERKFPTGYFILDGELYAHHLRDHFEDLISILRGDGPDAEGEYLQAEYHIYDMPNCEHENIAYETPIERRIAALNEQFSGVEKPLVLVDTVEAASLAALQSLYQVCLDEGYEGGMAKNKGATYRPGKRSPDVQKMKEFEEHEFKIVGVNDGRGKDAGTVATFDVALPCLCCGLGTAGQVAKARLKATYAKRREYMQKPELWQGKILTVSMKRWTAYGMPYIPVAKGVRDYE